MGRDIETSDLKDVYETQPGESELLEPAENSNPETIMADGSGFDKLDRLSEGSKKYERFRTKYERLMEKHIETQDELNAEIRSEHERVIEEYGDVIEVIEEMDERYEELDEEYRQMMKNVEKTADELIATLEDYSETEKSRSLKDAVQGSLFFGAGFLAADQYSFGGALDFYANAAMNYANEPETAILTLGLPLIGAWYLKSGFESWNNSQSLDNEASIWRQRKADIEDLEELEEAEKESENRRFPWS